MEEKAEATVAEVEQAVEEQVEEVEVEEQVELEEQAEVEALRAMDLRRSCASTSRPNGCRILNPWSPLPMKSLPPPTLSWV